LTSSRVAKNAFFGHFGDFQPVDKPNKLQYTQKGICNMIAGISFHWHSGLQYFCWGMRRNQTLEIFGVRKWVRMSLGFSCFVNFVCAFRFPPFVRFPFGNFFARF